MVDEDRLEDEAYRRAVDVLKKNETRYGFSASTERKENYYSVWARDHCITALGATLTGDESLVKTSKEGLLFLLKHQIDHGQVPSYVEIENKNRVYGGLGSITAVDANLWVVITCAIMHKTTGDRRFLTKMNMVRYQRFYRLFKAFDSNDCGLLEVPAGGDWADVMNRSYHILYDECLYYEALKALAYLFEQGYSRLKDDAARKKLKKRIRWVKKRQPKVKRRINQTLWLTKENTKKVLEEYLIMDKAEEKEYGYYLTHLQPFKLNWEWRFDSLGNLLAIATDVANKYRSRRIIRYALRNKVNQPGPVKALHPPVYRHEREWEHIYERKELPHTYHNGGIWPMIAGFWVYVLKKKGYARRASEELRRLAELLQKNDWDFNEYMHGQTGKSMGKKDQAWSAAGYVIAYKSVENGFNLFNFH